MIVVKLKYQLELEDKVDLKKVEQDYTHISMNCLINISQ